METFLTWLFESPVRIGLVGLLILALVGTSQVLS